MGIFNHRPHRLASLTFAILGMAWGANAASYSLTYSTSSNVGSSTGYAAYVKGISPLSYSGEVTIPATYKKSNTTYEVFGIESGAFSGSSITRLIIPKSSWYVQSLGSCTSLKTIIMVDTIYAYDTSQVNKVSRTAFTGTSSDCRVYVPKGFRVRDGSNDITLSPGDYFAGRPIEYYCYWVKFNANGGSGAMSNQKIYTDESTALTSCGFTREGYQFKGWATSATGAKAYDNKQKVTNLTSTINGTVNLYAVWEKLSPSAVLVEARQRYPWNGLVDINFTITGTSGVKYDTSLSAKDMAGNTNIVMNTIRKSDGSAANAANEQLLPGAYHWVWDAVADLPKNFKCERVTVSALASGTTNTSGEFCVDLAGMGPWEMRTARGSEAISYSTAWATNALDGAKAAVKVWPVKREKPKYIAIDLSGGTSATHYPVEYLEDVPAGGWSDEYKTSKLVLRHIPAGSFIMGGRATDYPGAVNTNLHMVTLTKDFYMGVFEVTQRQWELVMGNRPSRFTNETCYASRPVENASYADIRGEVKGITWPETKEVDESSFVGQLRKKVGFTGFDLPTEAQWEYACRAGTTTALSSGMNLSSMSNAVELAATARYAFNSGWAIDTYMTTAEGYRWTDWNCTTDKGTAAVGSYSANPYGLYDMDGNVCEIVLDVYEDELTQSIDPVGPSSTISNRRIYRGGGWRFPAWDSPSGKRHGGDLAYSTRAFSCGFRLCLQGGEVPELDGGTVLVNEAGEGETAWTPTKSGTYYLTHETQTNGVNGAEVLGAWFEVAGPELTFTPDGDLTPGVKIAIGGAGEGWTVRYEVSSGGQGAARPTGASPEYTAPITLNDSQTIRAIAFSDGGLESREFSATYSLMSVGSAVAKPRYPWNGKVDIDCEVKGDAKRQYLISLEALDLDGNTNLPVRTVVGRAVPSEPQSPANEFVFGGRGATALPPGTYRFTWDADADIAGDFDFANVAVKVSVEGSAIIAAKKVLPLEVAGYTGTEVLTNPTFQEKAGNSSIA